MTTSNQFPRVVIAGRPNVGKSTLFNRLYRKRRAITDPTPGVTRDAIEEICSLHGVPLLLIDTGGVKADSDDLFDEIVSKRSLSELTRAHLILFLIDVEGITPEDEFLLSSLRPYSSKVVLVVNKADVPEKDYLAFQYHSLGLGEPVVISSAHGRNIEWLTDVIIHRLGPIMEEVREDRSMDGNLRNDSVLEVVIAGKPNTGKSTLVNRLAGRDTCVVSEVAGTTRDTVAVEVEHKGQRFRFVDTAGIRRKARVSGNVEYYSVNRAIGAMGTADVTVLLVDANEGLSEQDKKITSQAVKKGKTVVMALNKWDEKNPDPERLKKAKDTIQFQFPILDWAPIVPVSALKGYGVPNFLNTIMKANRQQNYRVETSELNRAFADWTARVPPPVKNNRQYKIRYITQVSVKPVRFMAFVNKKDKFPEAYRRYIINQIRQDFGFDLVPVIVDLREARR